MSSFGERLKQEREKQSVTLDDISLSTKISTRMLRALEDERFDQLPGGIFNKGFIRAYARCLGMDEDRVIADYLAATTVALPGSKSENEAQPPILAPPSREELREELREKADGDAGLPWGIFAVVLLIAALGFASWGYYSRESDKGTRDSATSTAASSDASPARVAEPSSAPPSSDSGARSAEVAKASQTVPSPGGAESSQPATVTPPPSAAPDQSSPPLAAGFTVLIKARQDSWLSISVDGEVSTKGILVASSEKSVRAADNIVIRAGNVGALDFVFNGRKLPAQGELNEVKTLTFTPRGLQPSAAAPSPPAQLP